MLNFYDKNCQIFINCIEPHSFLHTLPPSLSPPHRIQTRVPIPTLTYTYAIPSYQHFPP